MNKKEAEEKINEFFSKKHEPEEVRKIKKMAMSYQIKLGDKRKKFCKKCYSMNLRVLGIKSNMKRIQCKDCGNIARWRLSN